MPLIEIKSFEDYLTMEQKQALIQRVTDAVSSLGDEDLRLDGYSPRVSTRTDGTSVNKHIWK